MFLGFQTIPQVRKQVKLKSALQLAFLVASLTWTSPVKALSLEPRRLHQKQFEAHSNYLSMTLQYEAVAEVRKAVESKDQVQLKNRGEAHITVITPPEFEILKAALSMEEINQIAIRQGLQKASFQIQCVGKAQVSPTLATYYLVVSSPKLLRIREAIEKAWKAKGGSGEFRARHFYPHITLGFTERDLHESDGVIKDERSCHFDLSTL